MKKTDGLIALLYFSNYWYLFILVLAGILFFLSVSSWQKINKKQRLMSLLPLVIFLVLDGLNRLLFYLD